ncbi:hypothetical protein [Streptomyces sp. BH105]|uniref:hypothetical protein n=1 Tax=Streptomyces sp. BH105 TaxID=3410408 RepID=UPI003CF3BE75
MDLELRDLIGDMLRSGPVSDARPLVNPADGPQNLVASVWSHSGAPKYGSFAA